MNWHMEIKHGKCKNVNKKQILQTLLSKGTSKSVILLGYLEFPDIFIMMTVKKFFLSDVKL